MNNKDYIIDFRQAPKRDGQAILDKPKRSEPTCHKFNQDQFDLFKGIDDYVKKHREIFNYLTPEQQWEVYKIHPFTKAIMDTAIKQYMETNHLL